MPYLPVTYRSLPVMYHTFVYVCMYVIPQGCYGVIERMDVEILFCLFYLYFDVLRAQGSTIIFCLRDFLVPS